MMSTESELSQKLGQMVRLLAVSIVRGLPRYEQISVLSQAGLPVQTIAEVLDVKPNTVSVALYAMKKSKKGGGTKRGKQSSVGNRSP